MNEEGDPPDDHKSEGGSSSTYKVNRLIRRYELGDLGDQLVEAWTGASDERLSLRELADRFNQEVLASELRQAGVETLDGEVENLYRLLTASEVSGGMRAQTRARLEEDGVDVEQLTTDFVSHRAIHTYLTNCRGVEYEAEEGTSPDKGARTVQRLRRRLTTVTDDVLARLVKSGDVDLGEFDVIVDVQILCRDCGTTRSVEEIISGEGCRCG